LGRAWFFHLRLHPGDVVAEQDDVVFAAVGTLDVIAHQRLAAEAEFLEHRDRALLVYGHLGHQFFKPLR